MRKIKVVNDMGQSNTISRQLGLVLDWWSMSSCQETTTTLQLVRFFQLVTDVLMEIVESQPRSQLQDRIEKSSNGFLKRWSEVQRAVESKLRWVFSLNAIRRSTRDSRRVTIGGNVGCLIRSISALVSRGANHTSSSCHPSFIHCVFSSASKPKHYRPFVLPLMKWMNEWTHEEEKGNAKSWNMKSIWSDVNGRQMTMFFSSPVGKMIEEWRPPRHRTPVF